MKSVCVLINLYRTKNKNYYEGPQVLITIKLKHFVLNSPSRNTNFGICY